MPDVDFVTGLDSRATFETLLGEACAAGEAPAVVICDVVGLKAVNEQGGFAAGDACLRAAAERLRTATPKATLSARLGGDELVAVFLGCEADALAVRAAHALAARGSPALRAASGTRRPREQPGPFVDRLYASLRCS